MNKWIPISERLPENESRVLMTRHAMINDEHVSFLEDDVVVMGLFFEDQFLYTNLYPCDESKTHRITAWMPLPQPYKGE